jgi:hypothetical protein
VISTPGDVGVGVGTIKGVKCHQWHGSTLLSRGDVLPKEVCLAWRRPKPREHANLSIDARRASRWALTVGRERCLWAKGITRGQRKYAVTIVTVAFCRIAPRPVELGRMAPQFIGCDDPSSSSRLSATHTRKASCMATSKLRTPSWAPRGI